MMLDSIKSKINEDMFNVFIQNLDYSFGTLSVNVFGKINILFKFSVWFAFKFYNNLNDFSKYFHINGLI